MAVHAKVGRERILEVAEQLFTQQDYRGVSIRDIAQACGVTNAALYYHFSSKEALFREVLEQHARRLQDRMVQAAQGATTTREKITAMLTEYATMASTQRSPLFLLRHRAAGLDRQQAREHYARLLQVILEPVEKALRQAQALGEVQPMPEGYSVASLLLGMLHGMVQHRRMCQQATLSSDDVQFVVDVFWYGIRGFADSHSA